MYNFLLLFKIPEASLFNIKTPKTGCRLKILCPRTKRKVC